MKLFLQKLQLTMESAWYNQAWWLVFLLPLSGLYCLIISIRRALYTSDILKRTQFDIPVIVIGNIVLGGTGKTPIVISIANQLSDKGYRVGIASRGYKSTIKDYPHEVKETESALLVGDEPYLLQHCTGCPVVVDPKRVRAVQHLIDKHQCQIVICDDGLQHLALKPGITIAIHPQSLVGNSANCIPAGPLREPLSCLENYDIVVDTSPNSKELYTVTQKDITIVDRKDRMIDPKLLSDKALTAVTAIARPERFIESLSNVDIKAKKKFYPDHYSFKQNDFDAIDTSIIMTEKDWVKCKHFNFNQHVYIAKLNINHGLIFQNKFSSLLNELEAKRVRHEL